MKNTQRDMGRAVKTNNVWGWVFLGILLALFMTVSSIVVRMYL